MTRTSVKEAIEKTYGHSCQAEGISEVFDAQCGWYNINRRYNSWRALVMGLSGLGRWSVVNIHFVDRFGVNHFADFARSEF